MERRFYETTLENNIFRSYPCCFNPLLLIISALSSMTDFCRTTWMRNSHVGYLSVNRRQSLHLLCPHGVSMRPRHLYSSSTPCNYILLLCSLLYRNSEVKGTTGTYVLRKKASQSYEQIHTLLFLLVSIVTRELQQPPTRACQNSDMFYSLYSALVPCDGPSPLRAEIKSYLVIACVFIARKTQLEPAASTALFSLHFRDHSFTYRRVS